MTDTIQHPKTLRQRDIVLFTVSAILLPDTLASVASAGAASISWWLILGLVFLLPFGLISAEMGCTYPEQGGIYAWVRDAFGGRWASRVTWCYWINVTVWMPAVYTLCAGIFNQLFELQAGLLMQVLIAVALTWLTVALNIVDLRYGKWIPNIGGVVKVLLFAGIIVGAFRYLARHEMANPMTIETLAPRWGEGLQYLSAIIYGMLGFELVSAGSEEMRNPARDVPRAILYSGVVVLLLYVLGTVAILSAIPTAEINLVEGLIDTLRLFFADLSMGATLVFALGIFTLIAVFSSGVTWALGSNRAVAEAALEGELPAIFAIETRKAGTPLGAAIMMGIASTAMLLLYAFLARSNEDLFWALFAFSGVLFLLHYLGMMLAFLRMRRIDGDRHRPYRVPGGTAVAACMAWTCILILSIAMALFMYTPGEGPVWEVIIGVIALVVVGECVIRYSERQRAGAGVEGI
jgi:amino acid transporter